MDDKDRADIEHRAYRRYEERGRADGDDQADWFEAEQEMREHGIMRGDDDITDIGDEMTEDAGEEERG